MAHSTQEAESVKARLPSAIDTTMSTISVEELSQSEIFSGYPASQTDTPSVPNITFGCFAPSERAKRYVNDVLESGRLSYGHFCEAFESRFAAMHGTEHAVCCNSGTSALHMALACMKEREGWQDGDEVLTPAVTFVATPNMILMNGLVPILVDVNDSTYNIDVTLLEEKITPRTRAIMPVHLFGLPCEMTPIQELAAKYDLRIIEDSAETMFANYKGKSVGSFGDAACFSTAIGHIITTGVGGLATTNDPDLAEDLRSFANHGRDPRYYRSDQRESSLTSHNEIVTNRFRFLRNGHNFRISEFEAALGLAQLEEAEDIVATRRKNANALIAGLKSFEDRLQLPSIPDNREHSFMALPLLIRDPECDRETLISFLENRGIETREMLPLLHQPCFAHIFDNAADVFPVANYIDRNGFFIGCHPYLTDADMDYVIRVFDDFFSTSIP